MCLTSSSSSSSWVWAFERSPEAYSCCRTSISEGGNFEARFLSISCILALRAFEAARLVCFISCSIFIDCFFSWTVSILVERFMRSISSFERIAASLAASPLPEIKSSLNFLSSSAPIMAAPFVTPKVVGSYIQN